MYYGNIFIFSNRRLFGLLLNEIFIVLRKIKTYTKSVFVSIQRLNSSDGKLFD